MFGSLDKQTIKGSNLTTESNMQDNSEIVSFTEGKDPEQESNKYQGVVAHVMDRFHRAKTARYSDEQRWLQNYRNFRGIYGPDVQFTDTEKSQAFIKITKTKVLAAYAQIVDILFANNKFPIGVEASPLPEGIAESVHFDPKEQEAPSANPTVARGNILSLLGPMKTQLERVKDKLKEGPGLTATAYTWEPAKMAAKKMDMKFQDQLMEANASKSLRSFAFELSLFGTGVYKGPMLRIKEYAKWDEEGNYAPVTKKVADMEAPSIWDAYPDPDARTMDEAEYFIQRHKMNKSQLRSLKKRPYFRTDSIELAINGGFNYIEEYWETELKDNDTEVAPETYDVLEFWGNIDGGAIKEELRNFPDIEIPPAFKDKDQVQVNIWVCNGYILRIVYNPFTPAHIPYYVCPYEINPYSIFGIGVAENMADTQLLMNGFMRLAVDNAVISSNNVFEVNENMLAPGQDMKVYPGKIFRTNGQIGQSIYSHKFQNVTQECLAMFDKARQLADEATGIPSYSHGQGGVQGIGRTAAGMSMLMGAAAQNIKAVVRNIDDYLLVPFGKNLFSFNMQFDFDKEFIGDLEVVARGTESLMRNEIRSQKLLEFMQLTNNPTDAPWVKRDYILRELAESLDLESDKVVNDPREAGIQAAQLAELMKAQGIDPNASGGSGGGMPPMNDPAATGAGQTGQPGPSPEPGTSGYTGTGGGANGGQTAKAPVTK